MQQPTNGQVAMSVDFNPGGREDVKELKQIFADAYDACERLLDAKLNGPSMLSEQSAQSASRWMAIAKTHLEEGQMAAVKSITR